MGYYDENGKMTIDEVAAAKDVKRMRESVEKLRASLDSLKALKRASNEMKGATATAISDKAEEMIRKINKLIDHLETAILFVNKTVKRYQQIDADLKKCIETESLSCSNAMGKQ